jgi:hypothetical protein
MSLHALHVQTSNFFEPTTLAAIPLTVLAHRNWPRLPSAP